MSSDTGERHDLEHAFKLGRRAGIAEATSALPPPEPQGRCERWRLATCSAAWWLTGWQRKYRTLAATNHDDVCRVIYRLTAAEKRYRRENEMGEYAMPNTKAQPDAQNL